MDMATLLSVTSIGVGLISVSSILIKLGQEKQSRADLERRHTDLSKEFDKSQNQEEKLADRIIELEKSDVARKAELENINHRLQEKASIESVEALRESMGRIEGTIMEVARRLETIADKLLGKDREL